MADSELSSSVDAVSTQERFDVLLVEDYEDLAQMLAMCLESQGYSVHIAPDVQSAIKAYDTATYSLVLSDLNLPDGTGVDLMRHLKERGLVRAIALSGYDSRHHQRVCREAGFCDYLVKPVDEHQLLDSIQRVLTPCPAAPACRG